LRYVRFMSRNLGDVMKINKSSFAVVSLVLFFAYYVLIIPQAEAKDIFIVHSYALDNICGDPQHQGVLESLAKAGFVEGDNLTVYKYAMDTKKVNNTPELIAQQAEIVLEKVKAQHPDVLVLLDDNAFRTVGLRLVDTDINIVFCGLNGQPEDYDRKVKWMTSKSRPGHNITGVYEKLHFIEACLVQQKILPDLKKILVIGDESPTGKAILKQINKELEESELGPGLEIEIRIAPSWEEYKKILAQACSDSSIGTIYPSATLLKDSKSGAHSTSEIVEWTVAHCRTPGIPLNYSFARLGMLGGVGLILSLWAGRQGKW